MTGRTRVKICCIADVAEAMLAIEAGADVLGLVAAMPSGPGPIDEAVIADIAAAVPAGVSTFLLTSLTDADAMIAQHRRCRTTAIQICDRVSVATYEKLRRDLPGVKLVQVIHVRDESSIEEAVAASHHVDAILLDSGNQSLAVKELGGTGRVHDWQISRAIVEAVLKPVFLAGGLNARNIGSAIENVQPFGVDLCSGVRTNGQLDPDVLGEFMDAVPCRGDACVARER